MSIIILNIISNNKKNLLKYYTNSEIKYGKKKLIIEESLLKK